MENKSLVGIKIAGLLETSLGLAILGYALYLVTSTLANPSYGYLGAILGGIFSLAAIFIIVVGIYVLKLKPWARITTLVLSGLFLLNICGMFMLLITPLLLGRRLPVPFVSIIVQGIIAIILIVSLFFFTRPKVKEQFK